MPRLEGPLLAEGTVRDRPQPTLVVADGLVLRPFAMHEGDVAAVLDAYGDPTIQRWHLVAMAAGSEDEARAWIDRAAEGWRAETVATWAVAGTDGEVVGRVSLGLRLAEGAGEVSYWVLPAHRGRGVAGRAVAAATRWAHAEVGLVRIELRHSTANMASCRVADRAGYDLEGTMRRARRHLDGWHDVHLHAHVAVPPDGDADDHDADPPGADADHRHDHDAAKGDDDHDEVEQGGDPACWAGLVDDHRDRQPPARHGTGTEVSPPGAPGPVGPGSPAS